LEVPYDVLIRQGTKKIDFSSDPFIFLGIQFPLQFYFLDGIYIPVDTVTGSKNSAETPLSYSVKFFKITGVPRVSIWDLV
jgi:hypothetical protein